MVASVACAPRIPPPLRAEIARLARRSGTIAEINRLAGAVAARLRMYKPSYEQVRVLVHAARRAGRARRRSAGPVAPGIAFGAKLPCQLLDRLWAAAEPESAGRAPPPPAVRTRAAA